jgi:hypothetical protein
MVVLPQVVVALAILSAAFGLGAVPLLRRSNSERKPPFGRIVPHPSQPGSMLSFVALPSFLILLTLVRLGLVLPVIDPVNSPDSSRRLFGDPGDVEVVVEELNGTYRVGYPRNTAELTANAARRFESARGWRRIQAVHDLAWWTSVCPTYVPFTVPRLARALRDPDPAVRGAAATGLGSTGGHGATAIPELLAVRGTTVRYFDHIVAEAVLLIDLSPRWPPVHECEDVPMQELERRAAQPETP